MNLFTKITKKNKVTKSYSYSTEGVSLDFSLDLLNKKELKNFIELLKVAIKDLEIDIK